MTSNQTPYFHDAIILAKKGAMVYVVDEDGNRLSGGHHEVTWDGGMSFKGKNGASLERFLVDTDNIAPFGARLNRKLSLDDIAQYAADERIAALAYYLDEYDHIPEVDDG